MKLFRFLFAILFVAASLTSQAQVINCTNSKLTPKQTERLKKQWKARSIFTQITLKNGNKLEGQLLHASDSMLYLYPGMEYPGCNSDLKPFYAIHPHQIASLKLKRRSQMLKKMGNVLAGGLLMDFLNVYIGSPGYFGRGFDFFIIGVVFVSPITLLAGLSDIGTGINFGFDYQNTSTDFAATLPLLKKCSLFPNTLPEGQTDPEIMVLNYPDDSNSEKPVDLNIQNSVKPSFSSEVFLNEMLLRLDMAFLKSPHAGNRLHVYGNMLGYYALPFTSDYSNIYQLEKYMNVPVEHQLDQSQLGFGISRSFGDNYRIGIDIHSDIKTGYEHKLSLPQNADIGRIWERSWYSSYSIVYDRVLLASTPLNKHELTLGVGLSYIVSSTQQNKRIEPMNPPPSKHYKHRLPGIYSRLSYDYYLTQFLSLNLKLENRLMPSIQLSEYAGVPAHKNNLSSFNTSFGIQMHF